MPRQLFVGALKTPLTNGIDYDQIVISKSSTLLQARAEAVFAIENRWHSSTSYSAIGAGRISSAFYKGDTF